jgi:RING finger protein 121/175
LGRLSLIGLRKMMPDPQPSTTTTTVLVVTINDTASDIDDDPLMAAAKKHAGHEDQHAQMFLVLVGSLVVMQFGLLYLRHQRPRAFHALSFLGLWAVPALLSAQTLLYHAPANTFGYWRFLFVWAAFSVAQAVVVVRLVNQRPLLPTTPRFVYRWFQRHYQVCYAIGITGYALLVCDFLGLSILLPESQEPVLKKFHIRNPWFFDTGVVMLFYGVYFGMLSRDLIETLSEQMAASIGYYNKDGLPSKHLRENICALCGDRVALQDGGATAGAAATSRPHLHGHS